jgi:hypothetical protein
MLGLGLEAGSWQLAAMSAEKFGDGYRFPGPRAAVTPAITGRPWADKPNRAATLDAAYAGTPASFSDPARGV